jgi:EAL domain-containing protein (putative c-di-GMP-specific phosphodiesterase class I)
MNHGEDISMDAIFSDDIDLSHEAPVAGYTPLMYFQPICSVKTRTVIGVEALARGLDASGTLVLPDRLFPAMAELGQSGPWEMSCRRRALATFSPLAAQNEALLLFVNLNLSVSDGQDDVIHLLEVARDWSVPPSRVVVEVLESRFDNTQRLAAILNHFRVQGFLVALDDMGVGHSNLDRVPLIRPDVLKVDRDLVRKLDADVYKQDVFKALVDLGRRIGALIVAEGVETEPEALTALELGADLLQGYLVSRPQPPNPVLFSRAENAVANLAGQFKRHMVRKTSERRLQHRQYNVLLNTLLCDLTCSPSADFGAVLEQAVQRFPAIECVYVLDETGIQVSATVCRSDSRGERSRTMFHPAPRGADHSLKEYYYMLLDAELQKYTTEPYVSLATGNLCQTISTCFRDGFRNRLYVLCIDVKST